MDAQKATEVEIKELTSAEVKYYRDEKDKVEETKDVVRKLKLHKRISVFFLVLTLLLLAVVLVLAIKLNESKSIQKCPDPPAEEKKPSHPVSQGNQCSGCGKDWYKTNTSCYLFVRERLNWTQSREECQKQGADLVVINNEKLQNFLWKYTGLMYWIGLHYSENKWMWVNNTALTKSNSYWARGQPNPVAQGSCALLKGKWPNNHNWHVNPCDKTSHYICQKRFEVDE
ncbi:CD209 antigen-like protein D isoform X1 [Clarias gariepinus]|uniref:CD209 antigen-like protein D isoform X1 n=1 Tax=Clarias gariepinus TaxID=13013 RepID=UPI00234D24FA|nr:CD209 antigen-like protein D isoform X1 [Clarias gariepinus]